MPELILAFAILSNPDIKAVESPCPPDRLAAMSAALQKVSVDLELLDPHYSTGYFARTGDYVQDINMVRIRYQKLKDAPRVWESQKFVGPDYSACEDFLDRSLLHYRKLWECRFLSDVEYLAIEEEIEYRDLMYRTARNASSNTYYTVPLRREALLWLKNELTPEQWSRGELLPLLPEWLIHESK